MSGSNLHKSQAGWVRLRAREARQRVREAQMDHRVGTSLRTAAELEAAETDPPETAEPGDYIIRKGRKRRRAFVAHNGRAE